MGENLYNFQFISKASHTSIFIIASCSVKVHLCVALKLQSMLLHNVSHHPFSIFHYSDCSSIERLALVDRVIEINFPDLLFRLDSGNCFSFSHSSCILVITRPSELLNFWNHGKSSPLLQKLIKKIFFSRYTLRWVENINVAAVVSKSSSSPPTSFLVIQKKLFISLLSSFIEPLSDIWKLSLNIASLFIYLVSDFWDETFSPFLTETILKTKGKKILDCFLFCSHNFWCHLVRELKSFLEILFLLGSCFDSLPLCRYLNYF